MKIRVHGLNSARHRHGNVHILPVWVFMHVHAGEPVVHVQDAEHLGDRRFHVAQAHGIEQRDAVLLVSLALRR